MSVGESGVSARIAMWLEAAGCGWVIDSYLPGFSFSTVTGAPSARESDGSRMSWSAGLRVPTTSTVLPWSLPMVMGTRVAWPLRTTATRGPSARKSNVLAGMVTAHQLMPRDAAGDARHLALATFHGCDVLATWNCRHLANVNKQAHLRRVNGASAMRRRPLPRRWNGWRLRHE